ncbi:sensor histidine kinase [Paenibacillus sp. MBLB4367]|uniref:sensor histidine kinase n=1 Tax=Paenibacillus sp. MBLB4367 TaxID=3384767 RepID=UPI003907F31B
MLFVWIALWLIGVVLLLSDPRKSSIRWLSAVAFCGGSGALSAVIGDSILPYAIEQGANATVQKLLDGLRILSSLMQYYGMPYSFALFALCYNTPAAARPWMGYSVPALLLPIAAMLLFVKPIHPVSYPVAALWALPYVAAGSLLVMFKREPTRSLRRNHMLVILIVVPTVVFCAVMNYVLPLLGFREMWRYNTWIIAYAVLLFLVAIFKYGFMGIQFLIEKKRLDVTIRAITSGTSILNHAIKNDVGKMKLFSEKIAAYASETNQTELAADIKVIQNASRHIQEMISRVHEQTQDLALSIGLHRPAEMIRELLEQLEPYIRHLEVRTELKDEVELSLDRAQIAETINNLIMNAAEAMPKDGSLLLRLYETKKHAVIEVRDTGPGIDKRHQKQVLEPFYSTKGGGGRLNFGLGLAYCYNVMNKHGGKLEIDSEPGRGTAVSLYFTKRRRGSHGTRTGADRRG